MLKWSEGRTCKDENKTHTLVSDRKKQGKTVLPPPAGFVITRQSGLWALHACWAMRSFQLAYEPIALTSLGLKQILIVCNSFKQGTSGNMGHLVRLALVANHLAEKSNPCSWTSWTTQGEIFTLRHIRPVLQMFKRKRFKQNLIARYRKKWRATRVWICVLLESQLKYQTM